MVKAWYMDDDPSDQRNEHHKNPPEFLLMDQVFERTGVEYFQLNPQTFETDGELEKIKKARGYTYEDEITCSEKCLENYTEKLKTFYTEHLHTDEEIRLVVEGSGFFDVRDKFDKWIRIQVFPGDLIVLPAGMYHRFTMDNDNFIRARRFFVGEPIWTAHNRQEGADEMEARNEYITNFVLTK